MNTSIIFNYFNPTASQSLLRTASYALEGLLVTTGENCEIICADGSGCVSDQIAARARDSGSRLHYEPTDRAEAFAETYNRGAALAKGEILVFCASDIFFSEPWLGELTQPLARGGVAMTCPYLSYSDYIAQCYAAPLRRNRFESCCMTINVNAIRRDTWEQIGPLDLAYTGNYNDLDYLIRLRRCGLRAVVVDCGLITHVGSVTLNTSSQVRAEKDRAIFAANHPEFATPDFWHRCWHPLLCRSRMFRFMLNAIRRVSPSHKRALRITNVLRWEPMFNRIG